MGAFRSVCGAGFHCIFAITLPVDGSTLLPSDLIHMFSSADKGSSSHIDLSPPPQPSPTSTDILGMFEYLLIWLLHKRGFQLPT